MKRLLFLLVILSFFIPIKGIAATSTYNLGAKDGLNAEVTVDGELLFYDNGGPNGPSGGFQTGFVRFKNVNAGEPLTIEFLSPVEFSNIEDSHLYIYDGVSGYPETNGWKKPVPAGYVADLTNGSTLSYTANSGIIEVLFYAPLSSPKENGNGWAARISTAPPKPMEWKGISANQNFEAYCYPGVQNSPIICVDITTDGALNPYKLTEIAFTMNGTFTPADINAVKCLYSSANETPGGLQVGTSYNNADGTLTFTDSVTLGKGHNYFWLVADITTTATPGHTLDATITKAVVEGVDRISSPLSPEGERTITSTLLMESGTHEYTVGDMAINFYDDGGPSGAYTASFNGTAIFRPGVDGKKVGIEFNNLDLFSNSSAISIGNNDVIKIYNGSTVSDNNLLATIIHNEDLAKVYSTAPDGALTVVFTTKTAYPTQGFAATVSLFAPQPMLFDTVVAKSVAVAKMASGATSPFMTIDLQTINTEPAAKASSFAFNLTQPEGTVASAVLYSTGNTEDGTAVKICDGVINGSNLVFTLAAPFELGQSHNYFRIDLTTAADAIGGSNMTLTPASVTVDGTVHNIVSDATATSIISNEALSVVGTTEYTIYGPWTFANSPSQYSYYAYDAPSGDQITIFRPGKENNVVEIDFSKLKITFPSYSYGSTPSFKIINGDSKNGTVLYEIAWANRNDACPTQTFRSTDPSGALTIVFNPNGQKGGTPSQCGWTANVNLFEAKEMTLKSVEGFQAPAIDLAPASANNPIGGLKITTEGNLNPLEVTKLQIGLKNNASLIKIAKLYSTDATETFDIANARLLATDTIAAGDTIATFNFLTKLPERTSYLWVTYDMADMLASDLPIDVRFDKITIGGTEAEITNPDPEGELYTKNMYYFAGDAVVPVEGSLMFYDDGGPDNTYTNTHKGTVTFRPANEGDVVKFHFVDFYTNISDSFFIYNGTGTEERLMELYSSKSNLADIISTADDGALTVVFNPVKNNTNRGWAIEVSSFTPAALTVDTIVVSGAAPAKVLRGSENNTLLHAAITVSGDKGNLNFTNLSFDALNTTKVALKCAKVFYTDTASTFSADNVYAIDTTGNLTFNGDLTVKLPGTYHFWLACDIAPDASSESRFGAKMKSITISGTEYPYTGRVEDEVWLGTGMKGTYTVGAGTEADYATIGAALSTLKLQGMEGPVVIEVEDGEYTEHVLLDAVVGNSSINTLTLRSKSRNRDAVVVNYEVALGGSDAQGKNGVLTFNGINHALVEDMTFTSAYEKMEAVVYVKGYSRFDTIRNCHIYTVTRTDIQKDVNLVRMAAINEANRNNDYFNVENCLLEGGYIGLYIGGTGYVALPPERGARIIGNTLRNQGSKGIYLTSENDATVIGNTIIHQGYEMASGYNAMDIYRAAGDLICANNIIDIKDCKMGTSSYGSTGAGIYVRGNVLSNSRQRFYNNDVKIEGTTNNTLYGFQVTDNVPEYQTIEAQNNTFIITGLGKDYSTAAYINTTFGNGCIFRNNILVSDMPGYAMRVNKLEQTQGGLFANNSLYSVTDSIIGGVGNEDYRFNEFNTTLQQTGSINVKPAFLSASIHELATLNGFNIGVPVDYITTDLAGRQRPDSATTIGAYEFADQTAMPVVAVGYPYAAAIGYNSAVIHIQSSLAGQAYVLVQDSSLEAPTAAAILASNRMTTLRAGKEGEIEIPGLRPNHTYRAYVVVKSFGGTPSEISASDAFTTLYQPTQVSTFENVETGATDFNDGTARFTGFTVVEKDGAPGNAPAAKVACTPAEGTVTLTNATNLQLNGFFMLNAATVSIKALDAGNIAIATKQVAPGQWRYINLRDMGLVSAIEFASTDTIYIDDFSGHPQQLSGSIADVAANAAEGDTLTLTAAIRGGVVPYTIRWTDDAGNVLATEATAFTSLRHSTKVHLSVTDAWDENVSEMQAVRITGSTYPATFEDLALNPESYWFGDEDGRGSFFSGSWEFANYYMEDYGAWAWFGYSNSTATGFTNYVTDQYNNVVGGGFRSSNFGVVFADPYWGPCNAKFISNAEGDTIAGVYITNSAWVKDAILNGDGMSSQEGGFAQGDYLMLKLTGKKADGTTAAKNFYLADYRDEDAAERYYINDWEYVPLNDMGKLTQLTFALEGTKTNTMGLTTPTYAIIDNLGGEVVRDTLPRQTIQLQGLGSKPANLSLRSVLEMDTTLGKIEYVLVDMPEGVEMDAEGNLQVMRERGTQFNLAVDVRQHGHTRNVLIPINMDTEVGVNAIYTTQVNIWPVPARESINVNVDLQGYTIEIFDLNGRRMAHRPNCSGHVTLSLDGFIAGNYVLRLTHPHLTHTRKIVVSH